MTDLKQIGPLNYLVRMDPHSEPFVAHADKLKLYYPGPGGSHVDPDIDKESIVPDHEEGDHESYPETVPTQTNESIVEDEGFARPRRHTRLPVRLNDYKLFSIRRNFSGNESNNTEERRVVARHCKFCGLQFVGTVAGLEPAKWLHNHVFMNHHHQRRGPRLSTPSDVPAQVASIRVVSTSLAQPCLSSATPSDVPNSVSSSAVIPPTLPVVKSIRAPGVFGRAMSPDTQRRHRIVSGRGRRFDVPVATVGIMASIIPTSVSTSVCASQTSIPAISSPGVLSSPALTTVESDMELDEGACDRASPPRKKGRSVHPLLGSDRSRGRKLQSGMVALLRGSCRSFPARNVRRGGVQQCGPSYARPFGTFGCDVPHNDRGGPACQASCALPTLNESTLPPQWSNQRLSTLTGSTSWKDQYPDRVNVFNFYIVAC